MRAKEFDPAQIDAAVRAAERELDDARLEQYRAFVESQSERATRLAEQAAQLEETLGAKHPRVAQRRALAMQASGLVDELTRAAERQSRVPDVSDDENLLYGRVLDPQGEPMPGLVVRVVPKQGGHDVLLAGGTTDDLGDFAIVYPKDEVLRAKAAGLELHVALEDGRGKHLYTSRDPVTFDGTQAEYFEFSMTTGRSAPDRPTPDRPTTGGPFPGRGPTIRTAASRAKGTVRSAPAKAEGGGPPAKPASSGPKRPARARSTKKPPG
jgi:hypothetical protein